MTKALSHQNVYQLSISFTINKDMSCFEVRGLIDTVASAGGGTYQHNRTTQNDNPTDEFYLSLANETNQSDDTSVYFYCGSTT